MNLNLAYSPCPNDTFAFHALAEGGLEAEGVRFSIHLHDVETLNEHAGAGTYEVSKMSVAAYLAVRDTYQLLSAGAALGFGCGPLLVARRSCGKAELARMRIAIPGRWTTAALLLRLWAPAAEKSLVSLRYDEITAAVREGAVDCGLLIHESRFTYREAGLHLVQDLGAWWEQETNLPIPLGCLAARRSLGEAIIDRVDVALRESVRRARRSPEATMGYVRAHAQEADEAVIRKHIAMFVNDYTEDLGVVGRDAMAALESRANAVGLGV